MNPENCFQDNTRYAFLQMDDRALIYRGADQPDMSVINPESDVWQHIKVGERWLYIFELHGTEREAR